MGPPKTNRFGASDEYRYVESPATCRHLSTLGQDHGLDLPASRESAPLIQAINNSGSGLTVVSPVTKLLACGDEGIGGMAGIDAIIEAVNKALS